MPERSFVTLPNSCKEELFTASCLLALAHSNIRYDVSCRLSATDATTKMAGGASSSTTKDISQVLYRLCCHKGEYVRLDWTDIEVAVPPTTLVSVQHEVESLLNSHKWTASRSFKFYEVGHVNVQELKALRSEIKHQALHFQSKQRAIHLVDSRVVAGAYAKGRSSSRVLNGLLRSCLVWETSSLRRISNLWVGTKWNPSDHPSRRKPIPAPSPAPDWLQDHCRNLLKESLPAGLRHLAQPSTTNASSSQCHHKLTGSTIGQSGKPVREPQRYLKEWFAGRGKLSAVCRASGRWHIRRPEEAFPSGGYNQACDILLDDVFRRAKQEARAARGEHWHFGIPCDSFSILNVNLNGGTRTRACPSGNGSLDREIIGNKILQRTLLLIRLLLQHNTNTFTLENPISSFLFRMGGVVRLMHRACVDIADFDQ